MRERLLTPDEVDKLLRYPRGRSARLARAGRLPSIALPDGELRFDPEAIERMIATAQGKGERKAVRHAR